MTAVPGPTVEAAVDDYLEHLRIERGLAANTIVAYRRDLTLYARYLAEVAIDELATVTPDDLDSFVVWLRRRPTATGTRYAAASVARITVAVRGLHRHLAIEGVTTTDAAAGLDTPRTPRPLPKALTLDDVERLLAAPVGTGPLVLRDRALLELLYGAGLRISELTALDLDDLDPVERLVRVLGKGDRERLVPYGEPAASALTAWVVQARPGLVPRAPALFLNGRGGRLTRQGAWQRVKRSAAKVGLEHEVTPHALRHSYATHLLDGGADVRAVQELLGHASVTTTQIYTLVSRSALRDAYELAHPRARHGS